MSSTNELAATVVLASGVPARTLGGSQPARPSTLRRAGGIAADALGLAGIILCIPAVILGIGLPIALFVRLLLWIGHLF